MSHRLASDKKAASETTLVYGGRAIMSQAHVTLYTLATSETYQNVTLVSMMEAIRSGKYKDLVDKVRQAPDKDSRRALKLKTLPAFTVSGTFSQKKAEGLDLHSGFIAMDFDDIEPKELDHARALLYGDDYTWAGFRSVSGNGICIIVPIDPAKHRESFLGLECYYYKKYGLQADQSTKNVNRLRYISYDPELYANPMANRFIPTVEKKTRRPKITTSPGITDADTQYVIDQILQKRVDITGDYREWCELGMALKSKYGDNGLEMFLNISQFHKDYDEKKATAKYKSFSETGGINMGTFFYIAGSHGITIDSDQTRTVKRRALYGAKNHRPIEDVVEEVSKMIGEKPEDVKPVVAAVYQQPEMVQKSKSDDLISQIEDFINSEKDIMFNEVTMKYELDGRTMTDRDFNSVYLDCRKVYPKVTKDLVISAIDSDRTKAYNPIKQYFAENDKAPIFGQIRKLANTIHAVNNPVNGEKVDYVYYFIRKWMIGAVAMWHKHHSPLMLILAGSRQNTGKSHWFRYLLPQELQPYYAEAELTGDKDENLMMCSKMLIMNDEMSNKNKRDIAMIKKLCSQKWFNLRKPYGRLTEDFRRIAALAGTSNDLALLSDPSGNRRLIPIEVHTIDHSLYNSIDKTLLWIEAYQAFRAGEAFELTQRDVEFLETSTDDFKEPSPEEELFLKYFDEADYEGEHLKMKGLTNSEIKAQIEIQSSQKLNARKLGMELKRLGLDQHLVRIGSLVKRVYNVKLKPTTANVEDKYNGLPF
jgi:predicted P-loop ATPase